MADVEAEREMTRVEVAEYLRDFADRLASGGKMTVTAGNDSATINPPETLTFEIEIDAGTSLLGTEEKHELDFGLSWMGEEPEDDELSIS